MFWLFDFYQITHLSGILCIILYHASATGRAFGQDFFYVPKMISLYIIMLLTELSNGECMKWRGSFLCTYYCIIVEICLQLYREVQKLLSAYPDLVSQFAAFLLPGQAVDCNCVMDNLLYTKADRCISALQVNLRELLWTECPSWLVECCWTSLVLSKLDKCRYSSSPLQLH